MYVIRYKNDKILIFFYVENNVIMLKQKRKKYYIGRKIVFAFKIFRNFSLRVFLKKFDFF